MFEEKAEPFLALEEVKRRRGDTGFHILFCGVSIYGDSRFIRKEAHARRLAEKMFPGVPVLFVGSWNGIVELKNA